MSVKVQEWTVLFYSKDSSKQYTSVVKYPKHSNI